jgi:hypothetical protein
MRWTRGLAFALAPVARERLASLAACSDRGRFRILGPRTVAIVKYDIEDGRGRLDSAHRKGGWGALSNDIRKVCGEWTSRSRTTLRGLEARAMRRA